MKTVRKLFIIALCMMISLQFSPCVFAVAEATEETTRVEAEEPETKDTEEEGKKEQEKTEQADTYEALWDETNEAYIISNAQDLKVFRDSMYNQVDYSGKIVYLLNDITLEDGCDVGTVGNAGSEEDVKNVKFQGTFDGRGHCIEGWNNSSEALFLTIGKSGKICNLKMKNVNLINASLGTTFAFYNDGTIAQCAVSGTISGKNNNYASFCCTNNGLITDCVSSANISTTKSGKTTTIAGIVSSNKGTVNNCVYYGILSATAANVKVYGITKDKITNSYYLKQDTYKKGGTPCTAEEMKLQSTYKGFDFDNKWIINENQNDGFPMLRSDFPELQFITKVPVSIEVNVRDFVFTSDSAMGACYFPLDADIEYAGKDDKVKEQFSNLLSDYQVKVDLREEKWKQDFLVDVPVNGVIQDFSKTNPDDYFGFSYKKNDEYEFYVTDFHYGSTVGIYYDGNSKSNSLSTVEKNQKIQKAEEAARTILNFVYEKYGPEAMDNTWFDFTCARANYYPAGTEKDEMFSRLSSVWKEYKDYQVSVGKRPETTETSRFVLAITAMGFDPTDVAGSNLIKELIDSDRNGKYFAQHYLAYALYSGRYGDYLSYAKGLVNEQMLKSKRENYSADDMATMYMQPVFLFYNKNATASAPDAYAIKNYVENEVLPWLQRSITGFGTFYSPYTHCNNNVWTDAQAQMLLALLGADYFSEAYVKNGNTILDYIIAHPEISLNYQGDESQCARAIVSLVRCYRGQKNLFDCTDVTGVREVKALINSLPSKIQESDKEEVYRVRDAFNALTAGQKKQVSNASVLEGAISCLDQIEIDKDVALDMDQRIASIGTVTLEKQALIQQIRSLYNSLTADQKARVKNYQILVDAENTLKKLQDEEAKKKKEENKDKDKKDKDKKKKDKNKQDKNTSSSSQGESKDKNKQNVPGGQQDIDKATDRTGSDGTILRDSQNDNGTVENTASHYQKKTTHIDVTSDQSSAGSGKGNQPLSKVSKKKNNKTKSRKEHLINQKQKKGSDTLSVSNKVLGESSLVLNEALKSSDSIFSSVPLWCYTGIFGAGILLFAIGIKMDGKSVKKEKSGNKDEEANR